MNDEKICPFMSRPMRYGDRAVFVSGMVPCVGEGCMAWGEIQTGNGVGCRLISMNISTDELVEELSNRKGVEYAELGKTTLLRGPCKILVVRE